jgi:hypothetical protein
MCGGFMVGNLAMFFATKYVDTGIHDTAVLGETTPISGNGADAGSSGTSDPNSPAEQRRQLARSNGALSKSGSGNLNRSSGKITQRNRVRPDVGKETGDVSFGSIALESQSVSLESASPSSPSYQNQNS